MKSLIWIIYLSNIWNIECGLTLVDKYVKRAMETNTGGYKELTIIMKYIHRTLGLTLILCMDNIGLTIWYIDV